jgi:PhnB protein
VSDIRINPYINFQGQARAAMEFYHKALGGTLDLQTANGQGASTPGDPSERITQARLEADGVTIIAVDGNPDYPAKVGENMALALEGADKERITAIFNALAEDGNVKMPLTEQFWGAEVGWLTDKFGINWMVTVSKK